MLIRKVIKYYFMFVMGIVSMASFAYVGANEQFLSSVFHINNNFDNNRSSKYGENFGADTFDKNFELLSGYPSLGTVKIMRFSGNFVIAGDKNIKIAEILIDSEGASMALKDLAFNIDFERYVDALRIVNSDFQIDGTRTVNGFAFRDINYLVGKGESQTLEVFADFSEDIVPGERVAFNIDFPSDFLILADENPYSVYSSFPVEIKRLTIGGKRK